MVLVVGRNREKSASRYFCNLQSSAHDASFPITIFLPGTSRAFPTLG